MIIQPISNIIFSVFKLLFYASTLFLTALLIYLGLQYTKAGPKKAEALKKWLPYLLGGILIVAASQFIPVILKAFLVENNQ